MGQHFLATLNPTSVEKTDQGVRVRALAFVEGRQKPVKGRSVTKSAKQLEQYAANSNKWLDGGREIPFFESPHDLGADGYSNQNKIGLFDRFTAAPITVNDIPSQAFSDLVGKTGIFSHAEIIDEAAIEKYQKGLIKEISVGLGDMGEGPQIFEGSAVPWGAVRGAQLFGHPIIDAKEADESAESSEGETQIYALTLEGAIAEGKGRWTPLDEGVEEVCDMLRQVLRNIRATTDGELQGRDRQALMTQAVDDFSIKIRKDLGLAAFTPIPAAGGSGTFMKYVFTGKPLVTILSELQADNSTAKAAIAELSAETSLPVDQFVAALSPGADELEHYTQVVAAIGKRMKGGETGSNTALTPEAEQRFAAMEGKINQFAQRAETAETELAAMKARQVVGDRYMALKAKATRLNSGGKLSAVAFSAYFPDEQFSEAVERFSAAPTTAEGEEKAHTLDEIGAALDYLEKFGAAIETGSISGADTLNPKGGELSAEGKADMERFITSQGMDEAEAERYRKEMIA